MMKLKIQIIILAIAFSAISASGQTTAQERAERMRAGMNLSYLDNYWLGTKEKNFADFVKPKEAAKREKMMADIARAGFKTVRIPIDFGAWASLEKPYRWNERNGLEFADKFVKWALDNKLNAIVDLHHVEFNGSVPGADATDRVVWLWRRIAERYKNTDPERVFFEIRNEPHDIAAADWREQAERVIAAIRRIAPRHTLIVGFHDWNSRQALIESEPFKDENIIYTFHYYDPFIFTHQGATWSAPGLPELRGVPFPFSKEKAIETPETGRGKWVGELVKSYQRDSDAGKMLSDLRAAKNWSKKNGVPIFLGEFGSFTRYASEEDRCRHAEAVYGALGKLDIPNAWWEWDGSFNMFEKGTDKIAVCMRRAIELYTKK